MNKDRRKAIAQIAEDLQKALDMLDSDQIETIKDEEQDYYDNMPESFQSGEKGDMAQAAIDHLDTAKEKVDEAITALTEAIEALGEAQE